MANVTAKLVGDKALARKLDKLAKNLRRKVDKKIIRAGATPIKKSIKRFAPVDEGHYKKSIDFKITGKGAAIIGPDANYHEGGEAPANYAHLIEYGHVMENGQTVPGQHPVERGYKAAEAESAKRMTDKAEQEINKLL